MPNTQKIEKQFVGAYGAVQVHSMFLTIQGEGPYTGDRAIFIRLAGCNLQCPGCDTDYTSAREEMTPAKIIEKIVTLFPQYPKNGLIVVTGGEPFRQTIGPLLQALVIRGHLVQIESNGVREPDSIAADLISQDKVVLVVSPKTSRVHDHVAKLAHVWKYVLRDGDISAEDGLPLRALEHAATPHVARPPAGSLIYINPYDEKDADLNRKHVLAAVESCSKYGYRLGLQLHKLIEVE